VFRKKGTAAVRWLGTGNAAARFVFLSAGVLLNGKDHPEKKNKTGHRRKAIKNRVGLEPCRRGMGDDDCRYRIQKERWEKLKGEILQKKKRKTSLDKG